MTTIRKSSTPEQPAEAPKDPVDSLPAAISWPAKVFKQFGPTGLALCFVVPLYMDLRSQSASMQALTSSSVTAIERSTAAITTLCQAVGEQSRLNEKTSESILNELRSIRELQIRNGLGTAKNP